DMKDPRLTPRAAQSNTAGSAAGAQSANPNEPKKVRTVAIRPDGSVMPDASRPTALDPSRGLPPVPRAPSIPAPRPGQVALAPSGAPATTGSAPSNPALPRSAVPAGSHVVQLTSQRSEAEAQSSYRVLQSRYPSVLGSRQPLIRRVELGDRGTYYRAQVGPFASADEANELCTSLKAAGGQCIVQRN
ncbi:MAG: SPOR domain-containing protein, partial [Rhizobiales bacterium]|nr:SPOR domain-containing protein [Hyphomicrobiales bacterium]